MFDKRFWSMINFIPVSVCEQIMPVSRWLLIWYRNIEILITYCRINGKRSWDSLYRCASKAYKSVSALYVCAYMYMWTRRVGNERTAAEKSRWRLQDDIINPDWIEICSDWLIRVFQGLFPCNRCERLKVKFITRGRKGAWIISSVRTEDCEWRTASCKSARSVSEIRELVLRESLYPSKKE